MSRKNLDISYSCNVFSRFMSPETGRVKPKCSGATTMGVHFFNNVCTLS